MYRRIYERSKPLQDVNQELVANICFLRETAAKAAQWQALAASKAFNYT